MEPDRSTTVGYASACFDNLLAFADARGDHLLAALLTDAWSHFQSSHGPGTAGNHDAS